MKKEKSLKNVVANSYQREAEEVTPKGETESEGVQIKDTTSPSAAGCAKGQKRQSVVLEEDMIHKLRIHAAQNKRTLSKEIQVRLLKSMESDIVSLGET